MHHSSIFNNTKTSGEQKSVNTDVQLVVPLSAVFGGIGMK